MSGKTPETTETIEPAGATEATEPRGPRESLGSRESREIAQPLADAVELARAAVEEVAGATTVGEHARVACEAENTATHYFESELAGYRGWQWACVVSASGDHATIDEIALLPGPDALLAPEWVPWSERVRPGDLGAGDVLPVAADDERLAPGYSLVDDGAADLVDNAVPLGLGKERVLSPQGRAAAAQRWFEGDFGPRAASAQQAENSCGSCGFLVPLGGSLGRAFGVCANELSADGHVVSLEYGCGAHSATREPEDGPGQAVGEAFDDHALDVEPNPVAGAADSGAAATGRTAAAEAAAQAPR